MKKRKYRVIIFGILWTLGFLWIFTGNADFLFSSSDHQISGKTSAAGKSSSEIKKEIQKKNEETSSAKKEKEELQRDIADIEKKKGDMNGYIRALDEKSNKLAEKIVSNQKNIKDLKEEIKQLRTEKKKQEEQKKKQYETMKKRIKYMYENGTTGYLSLVLGADNLSDFFNRAEYVEKVTRYDKNLLENYQATCQKIARAEKKLETSLSGLFKARESLKVERASVTELVDKKRAEVAEYQDILDDKSASLNHTEVLLSSQENELEKLIEAERQASAREALEREKKEQEAKERAEKEKQKAASKPSPAEKNTKKPAATKRPAVTNAPKVVQTQQPEITTASGGYGWPLSVSGRISSYFGPRNAPAAGASSYHKGIDISVPVGTSVLATKAGTVITATYSSSAGNYIAISHGDGVYSYYMHCSALKVSAGQTVSGGQQIALSGNSGISTGPHLHFGLYMGGSYVNPLSYVK